MIDLLRQKSDIHCCSIVRELDCVGDQIDENLRDACFIRETSVKLVVSAKLDFELLHCGLALQ